MKITTIPPTSPSFVVELNNRELEYLRFLVDRSSLQQDRDHGFDDIDTIDISTRLNEALGD